MKDPANEATEALLKRLERKIDAEYQQAYIETRKKFLDYMRRFRIKDDIKRKAWEAGVITKDEYVNWRMAQIQAGLRWADMSRDLATDYHNANEIAKSWARDTQYTVFAENHNFSNYVIEQTAGVNLTYTLYSHDTVERLITETPKVIPALKPMSKKARDIAAGKDIAWNMQKVTSALTQGILQGESIPKVASRLRSVAQMDHNASIRNARTMVTSAQNAGRVSAEKYAKSKGVDVVNVWAATLDMRTRHEHRILDGQRREVDEPFEVDGEKIMFPGDPEAPGYLVYNCRCTLIPQIKGFEYDIRKDPNLDLSQINGMSYEEWKNSKVEISNPITLPEIKAKSIKGSYINQYKNLRKQTEEAIANSATSGIMKKIPQTAEKNMSFIGNIDIEKYKCVTNDIKSDRVIVTETQIAHIKKEHPEALESLFKYGGLIVSDPDYILEANKPNSAVLLKQITEKDGTHFQMILRLKTSNDPEGYENSVITFLKINEKRYNRYIKAKKVLYKKE